MRLRLELGRQGASGATGKSLDHLRPAVKVDTWKDVLPQKIISTTNRPTNQPLLCALHPVGNLSTLANYHLVFADSFLIRLGRDLMGLD